MYLPVEVKVFGPGLVAARPIAFGQPVAPEDMHMEEVELGREGAGVVTDPAHLDGKTAARMVGVGQVLRADYFRAQPVVGAGDTVRMVLSGTGFSITASGRALGSALDGQPVRVQTDSGRVVQGIARSNRVVEMRL